MVQSDLAYARALVLDHAGFYDLFAVAAVIEWFPTMPSQALRDAIRSLEREGVIERVSRGIYRWVDSAAT